MWPQTEIPGVARECECEGAAAYGGGSQYFTPEFDVIGPSDDRFQIPARTQRPSTLLFPTNTVCFIETSAQTSGTGALIAPQVVLTAKHVLKRLGFRSCGVGGPVETFHDWVRVTPAADFSAARPALKAPFGQHVATAHMLRADPQLDYGIIILPKPVPRINRFMRLQARTTPRTATKLTIAGYPCDKPRGTMWGHSGSILLTDISPTHLRYKIDTCPGHSGSPIWLLGNNDIRLVLGVHTAGSAGCPNDPVTGRCQRTGAPVKVSTGKNCGVRITPHVINTIIGWCRAARVPTLPVVDGGGLMRR